MDEIFRSYLILFLNNTINPREKIILAKDALEISKRLMEKHKDAQGTLPYNKMLLLKEVASLYERGINNIDAFNKIFFKGSKWVEFQDEIRTIMETQYNESEIDEFKRNLTCEKQYLATEVTVQKFREYIDKLDSRSFKNMFEMNDELKSITETLYMDFVRESNLAKSLDGVTEIDFNNSEALVDKMFEFFDGRNFISTGYKNMDELFGGGFENTRLYILAGRPGSGKSTFLINFFYHVAENILTRPEFSDRYVLYVSLENLGTETIQRLICKILKMPSKEFNTLIRNKDINFKNTCTKLMNDMKARGARIVYFPSRSLSPSDLFSYIEKVNSETNKKPLCVLVDYLDIMKLPAGTELRHQLGDIALDLKSIAVQYQIPVITVTQLVKNAYEGKPTLGSIKESSEKIDHADAIGLLHRLDNGENIEQQISDNGYNVEMSFDKSRGSGNGTLRFIMDPAKFNIEEGKEIHPNNNMVSKQSSISGNVTVTNNGMLRFNSPSQLVNNNGFGNTKIPAPLPPRNNTNNVPPALYDEPVNIDDFSL